MKYVFIRSQLVVTSVLLLLTFGMMMVLVTRFNARWDFTKEKIYSIAEPTEKILKKMDEGAVEVFAFYPVDDPARDNFEVFLKECQLNHPNFQYSFYDPDRVPRLAKEMHIQDIYTVIVRYADRQERILKPSEERFTNALLRLAQPKRFEACFITGHGEPSLSQEDRAGYNLFRQSLELNNYAVHEVILTRGKIPEHCQMLMVAGPHRDLDREEWKLIKNAFYDGKGIFFLLDPMDPGTGMSFRNFMNGFGITVGEDVIVDKMSRMVGGDFLVPLVSQYVTEHPVTDKFDQPTFFPVARSVQPSVDETAGLEVVPLALSGSGSWAETNLEALEKGEAAFESETDLAGPICLAVAVEEKMKPEDDIAQQGRMVVVGDSDFLTNAYVDLSGNKDLALNVVQWLVKDDRFISIRAKQPEFKPLFINPTQRWTLVSVALVGFPGLFFLIGAARIFWRQKAA